MQPNLSCEHRWQPLRNTAGFVLYRVFQYTHSTRPIGAARLFAAETKKIPKLSDLPPWFYPACIPHCLAPHDDAKTNKRTGLTSSFPWCYCRRRLWMHGPAKNNAPIIRRVYQEAGHLRSSLLVQQNKKSRKTNAFGKSKSSRIMIMLCPEREEGENKQWLLMPTKTTSKCGDTHTHEDIQPPSHTKYTPLTKLALTASGEQADNACPC